MSRNHVAYSGLIYSAESGLFSDPNNLIGRFRGGASLEDDETVVEWFGQRRVRKGATLVRRDSRMRIGEVAFNPEALGRVYGIDPVERAALKRVSAVVAGANEATVTTNPGSDEVFEEDEPVILAEATGRAFSGFVDDTPLTTTVKFDDGSDGAVADVDTIGVMADVDYLFPQYFTRADDVLFDIEDGEDLSILIRFERRREGVMEVLMAKTTDASGTAFGTTAGWVLFVDSNNILRFAVNDGTDAYIINGTTSILEGEMRCVIVTFDDAAAANCKIYLEGYDDTKSKTGTLASIGSCANAALLSVAAEADGNVPFDGYIAEAAIYHDAVISAADALAAACAPRAEAGAPDAWWPFYGAAADVTITDEAGEGNNFHLTLVGGTTTNFGTHSRDQIAVLTANLLGFDLSVENAGVGNWTRGDAASEIRKNTQYLKYGNRSFRIQNKDASQAYARHSVETEANQEYHFHGWFFSPDTPNGASTLVNVDTTASMSITVTQAEATTGRTWYEIEFDFEAGDGDTTIDLASGSVTDTEVGFWDFVQVTKNYIDAGGFESTIAGSDWTKTGLPTVDDADTSEQSGTLCYKINSDDPVTKYVSQNVTLTSGKDYTFCGHIKCGTAEKAVVVLSGAASVTLDNGAEDSDWVEVTHRFTAATGTLTIKIYGNGADARFDNFSVSKVAFREWHIDNLLDRPDKQFLLQFHDSHGYIRQFYASQAKMSLGPINFTNMDMVVEDLEVMILGGWKFLVENYRSSSSSSSSFSSSSSSFSSCSSSFSSSSFSSSSSSSSFSSSSSSEST